MRGVASFIAVGIWSFLVIQVASDESPVHVNLDACSISTTRRHSGQVAPDPIFHIIDGRQMACENYEARCGRSCIPSEAECCSDYTGSWCSEGSYCSEGACCQHGTTCSGPPTGCSRDSKMCGRTCIPRAANCCDSSAGSWCYRGELCSRGDCVSEDGSFTGRPVQTGMPEPTDSGRRGDVDDSDTARPNTGNKQEVDVVASVAGLFLSLWL